MRPGRLRAVTSLNVVLAVLALLQARFFTIFLRSSGPGRHVEAISWDYDIPFVPWMILAYMSVYVLLALTPEFENWMFYSKNKKPTDEAAYRKQLALLDPIDALPGLGAPALFQLAEQDFYVPAEQIGAWRRAISGRGELRTYPTGHGMEGAAVRSDRQAWLADHLGFSRPRP